MENPPQRRLGYRNLKVWKQAMILAESIYELTLSGRWESNRSLRDQLRRSTLSVPSNIAEGEEQITNKSSLKYAYIARGSLSEARTQLILAKSQLLISQEQFDEIDALADSVARLLGGLIRMRKFREAPDR